MMRSNTKMFLKKENMKTKNWLNAEKIFFKIFNIKSEKKTILSWGLTINKEKM